MKIYINGEFVSKEEAKISVFDHGLLYGDGVFEGLRIYSRNVFLLEEHIDRLYESADAIRLTIPLSKPEMLAAVNETVRLNEQIDDGYIRLIVTRGAGALGLDINRTSDPQVVIIADTISLYPQELYDKGLKIITASTIRNHPQALSPRIKSLNYLNNILAKIEGADADCLEALMMNHKGEVAECTGDNIFILKNGVLKTPPTDAGILEGITRNAVIGLARRDGITVEEVTLIRHDIYVADECFLTGSAAEVIAVVELDGRKIGSERDSEGNALPGPVTKRLKAQFEKLTRGEITLDEV